MLTRPVASKRVAALVVVAATLALVTTSCTTTDDRSSSKDDPSSSTTLPPGVVTTTTPEQAPSTLLTSTDGYLLAVDTTDASHTQFISVTAPTDANDPASPSVDLAVHDQACFIEGTNGRFAMPVDAASATGDLPTWGIFQLTGSEVGSFSVSLITTLGATPGQSASAQPYGCASLSDGRLVTTTLGSDGQVDGGLAVWFGPFERNEAATACTVDAGLDDPRGVWVDEQDRVLVASSGPATAGVWRYSRLPTGADAAGGCGGVDTSGTPVADKTRKDPFVTAGDHGLTGPSGIASSVDHGIFVSSAISGVINEYDANGDYRTTILAPDPGESLDETTTFFAGTPLGMAIDVDGTLYYADPGWLLGPSGRPVPSEGGGLIQSLDLNSSGVRPELFLDSLTNPTSVTIFAPSGGPESSPL